jgi:hypothetical protein
MPVYEMARRSVHDDGLNPPDLIEYARDGVLLRLRMDAEVPRIREELLRVLLTVTNDSILPTAHSASFLGDANTRPPNRFGPPKSKNPTARVADGGSDIQGIGVSESDAPPPSRSLRPPVAAMAIAAEDAEVREGVRASEGSRDDMVHREREP